MSNFLPNNKTVVCFPIRIITEIAGYHKEKRNREATDGLYGCPGNTRKLTVHKDYANASNPLYEIKAMVILFCFLHNNKLII